MLESQRNLICSTFLDPQVTRLLKDTKSLIYLAFYLASIVPQGPFGLR